MTLKCKRTCEWYYGLYITSVKCAMDFVMNTFLPLLFLPILILGLHSHRGCSHTHQYPVRGLRICSWHWFLPSWANHIEISNWNNGKWGGCLSRTRIRCKVWVILKSVDSSFAQGFVPMQKKQRSCLLISVCGLFFLSQDVFWKNDNKTDSLCCTFNSSTLCTKYERC